MCGFPTVQLLTTPQTSLQSAINGAAVCAAAPPRSRGLSSAELLTGGTACMTHRRRVSTAAAQLSRLLRGLMAMQRSIRPASNCRNIDATALCESYSAPAVHLAELDDDQVALPLPVCAGGLSTSCRRGHGSAENAEPVRRAEQRGAGIAAQPSLFERHAVHLDSNRRRATRRHCRTAKPRAGQNKVSGDLANRRDNMLRVGSWAQTGMDSTACSTQQQRMQQNG